MSDCLTPVSKQEMLKELLQEMRDFEDELLVIASDLDKHHDKVKITRVSGGVGGIVGGGMAFCLIAAPFTAGISLIVAGGIGAGISILSAVTTVGGWGVGKLIQWKKLREPERKRQALQAKLKEYSKLKLREYSKQKLKEYKNRPDSVGDEVSKWYKIWMAFRLIDGADEMLLAATEFITTGKLIASGMQIPATAGRVAGAVLGPAAVLNVLGIGLSVYDMVQGAIEIHKKTKSPAGDYLRKLAKEMNELTELIEKS